VALDVWGVVESLVRIVTLVELVAAEVEEEVLCLTLGKARVVMCKRPLFGTLVMEEISRWSGADGISHVYCCAAFSRCCSCFPSCCGGYFAQLNLTIAMQEENKILYCSIPGATTS